MNRRTFLKLATLVSSSLGLLGYKGTPREQSLQSELLLATSQSNEQLLQNDSSPFRTQMEFLGRSRETLNDECITRAPIPFEWNPYNWFLVMFTVGREQEFADFLQSLRENPPDVMAGSGFSGTVPFNTGTGAIQGYNDPLFGNWTIEHADPCTGYLRLPPGDLQNRIDKLAQYTQALHDQGGVKRVMPYIDFGTQFFGRHTRPSVIDNPCTECSPNVAPSTWGFWEFYDHWHEYAQPTGPFDLGPKPPDPTTWLRRWHDPDGKQSPDFPDELNGLSFSYGPHKCDTYGPHYRYALCVNSEGWSLWWKQVVQWAARVGHDGLFIDNAYFVNCWNQECQEGYRVWLTQNFTEQEIRRYFTTTPSNLFFDPSIEQNWFQEAPGQWRTSYWGALPGLPNRIFPDIDAYSGRYSCRLEGVDDATKVGVGHSTQAVPADQDMGVTFYYKTAGTVQVKMIIQWENQAAPPPSIEKILELSNEWTQATVDFHTPVSGGNEPSFYMRFELTGTGTLWLDEFWLGNATNLPELHIELAIPSSELDNRVRMQAANTYWSQVADEKLGYLREEARKINPQFELFTNGFHAVNVDYFMSEFGLVPELDRYRQEQRKDVGYDPGFYLAPDPVLVTNAFGYKYIHSRRHPDHFAYHIPYMRPLPDNYHNPDSALLNLAEAATFGGGAGREAADLRHSYFQYNAEQTAKIRAITKQFWAFIQVHKDLYEGYQTYADVGIVFHDLPSEAPSYGGEEFLQVTDLAKDLAGRGLLWNVLTENRCNAASFAQVKALIYQDVARISEAEVQAVQTYLEQGGLVIAGGIVGDLDEWFRMRLPEPQSVWPPVGNPPKDLAERGRDRPAPFQQNLGAGTIIYEPNRLTADTVVAALETHLGRTVQLIGGVPPTTVERLRVNAWISQDGGHMTIHIVNYNVPLGLDKEDQVQVLENVQIRLPLLSQMHVQAVTLYSPETDMPSDIQVDFSLATNETVSFEIPRMRIYTIAKLMFSGSIFLPSVEK